MRFFLGIFCWMICATVLAQDCGGPYAGQKLTRDQVLDKLVDQELNFCGALLDGVDLSQMHLTGTDFSYASMRHSLLNGTDLSRANLTGANLTNSQLEKTYFRWANLSQAILAHADINQSQFQQANLHQANLSRTSLVGVNFTQADLSQANLSLSTGYRNRFNGANLYQADVRSSQFRDSQWHHVHALEANFNDTVLYKNDFTKADFSQATFEQANLSDSRFVGTLLKDTHFQNADLLNVEFRPSLEGHPLLAPFATTKNLSTLTFSQEGDMTALKSLSLAYHAIGYHAIEKSLASRLKTQKMFALLDSGGVDWLEGAFQYLFFYLTCDFGAAPARPLLIYLALLFLMVIPYHWSLGNRSAYAGINVNWQSRKDPRYMMEVSYQHIVHIYPHDPWIEKMIKHYRKGLTAFYFSLLSSVRLGWQDFNLANIFSQIQTREYELRPKGWVRSVSGLQSIVSAYLIILWALTYFGHPFHW